MSDLYPTTPSPAEGATIEDAYLTAVGGEFPNGRILTRAERVFPLATVNLRYSRDVWSTFSAIYAFFVSQRGRYGTFDYRDFDSYPWPDLYVGVGTNPVSASNDLPYYGASGHVIKVAGTTRTLTTHYTISAGAGANGRDRVVWVVASEPTSGQIITCAATGYRMFQGSFVTDVMSFARFCATLAETGLGIRERR